MIGEAAGNDAYSAAPIPSPPAHTIFSLSALHADVTLLDLDPTDPLYPIALQCDVTHGTACDTLFDQSDPGSDFNEFGDTCGDTQPAGSGDQCADRSGGFGSEPFDNRPPRRSTAASCRRGSARARATSRSRSAWCRCSSESRTSARSSSSTGGAGTASPPPSWSPAARALHGHLGARERRAPRVVRRAAHVRRRCRVGARRRLRRPPLHHVGGRRCSRRSVCTSSRATSPISSSRSTTSSRISSAPR